MHQPKPVHLLVEAPAPQPQPEAVITPEIIEDWAARQKKLYGWFWMVDESSLPKIEFIQQVVCRYFNIVRKDFLSQRRTADVVYPRQIAMFLCKEFTKRSLPEIGRKFGGRDHTTVLHSVRVVGERANTDETLAEDLRVLRDQIKREHQ